MSNKKLLAIATGAALLAGAQGASAGITGPGTANYDITLTASCSLQVNGRSFGTYAVEAADLVKVPAGSVDVTCSNGTPYTVLFDGGLHQDLGVRRMSDGSAVNYMLYDLFDANNPTFPVGDANSIDPAYASASPYPYDGISGTGTGASQSYNLVADVLIQSSPVAGTYTDAVAVTVTF